jgi:hypothetical protein
MQLYIIIKNNIATPPRIYNLKIEIIVHNLDKTQDTLHNQFNFDKKINVLTYFNLVASFSFQAIF